MVTSLTSNNPCIPIQYVSDGGGKGTGVGLVHVETIPTSADLSGVSCAHHGASTGRGGASISNGVVAVLYVDEKIRDSSFFVRRPSSILYYSSSVIRYPLSIVECRDRVVSESEKAKPKRNIGHQSVTNSGWSSYPKGNQM
jgi:hypothetical protein